MLFFPPFDGGMLMDLGEKSICWTKGIEMVGESISSLLGIKRTILENINRKMQSLFHCVVGISLM